MILGSWDVAELPAALEVRARKATTEHGAFASQRLREMVRRGAAGTDLSQTSRRSWVKQQDFRNYTLTWNKFLHKIRDDFLERQFLG